MSKLAIVIPAYKNTYFDQALLSIENQTNKNFTLYIGDDCSPDNLYSIVKKYEDKIQIVYKHFNENLGGKNLVSQWERCIDLVGDEEWIWLFSDDDMIDSTCVEHFYNTLKRFPDFDLFHFNVIQIDEYQNKFNIFFEFPEILTSEDFLINKLLVGHFSTVVEYIFRKSHFHKLDRFQSFDLAWYSDDATWIKLGKNRGIRNIANSNVYWRKSPFNISTNNWDPEILERKYYAQLEFTKWAYTNANQKYIQINTNILNHKLKTSFFRSIKINIKLLSFGMLKKILSRLYFILDNKKCPQHIIAFIYLYKTYRIFIEIVKKLMFWEHFKLHKPEIQSLIFHRSK
jgi:glycosyltransferase involved in cell wall biosynthesis